MFIILRRRSKCDLETSNTKRISPKPVEMLYNITGMNINIMGEEGGTKGKIRNYTWNGWLNKAIYIRYLS